MIHKSGFTFNISLFNGKLSRYSSNRYTILIAELSIHWLKLEHSKRMPLLIWQELMFTLSHIQQNGSRRLWKHLGKNMETLNKWRYNYWKMLKIVWQMRNCSIRAISPFVILFWKVIYCRGVRKHLQVGKG